MSNKLSYAIIFAAGVTLASCNSKMSQFKADYFNVNPNPLEVVGQKVPATVTANVPPKFFVKNAEVTVTPTLVYEGGSATSAPYTFQGEKVRGNNPVVNYANGGTMTIPVSYDYIPEMIKSDLVLNFEVVQGGKKYVLPAVTVANGVVATAALTDVATINPASAQDKFQRIINEKYSADIRFLINRANIRESELKTPEMQSFNQDLLSANRDSSRVIEEINISSYASPDGALDFNTRLAEERETTTQAYLKDRLKKDNITEFGELTAQFTPEDWEGFQRLVAASDIQDKDLIISVLSMYKDPEQRETEIRNISNVFEQVADQILPQLRYSRLTASVNVIGRSDEQLNKQFDTDPSKLSVDELLYTATLTNDNDRKKAIYEACIRQYPDDYRAYNNLGRIQFQEKDFTAAEANFARATRLNPNAPEISMNEGVIALLKNDYNTANQKFGNAGGVKELDEALGTYYLLQGDNNAAARAFGDVKSNNAAVAQILTKDYSKARNTLSGISNPDATTYYLMAVLGARTNNENAVMSNLRQAIKLDDSLAKQAMNDIEFSKFNLSSVLN